MQLQTIIDTPEIFIGYDLDNQWLHADWKGAYNQEGSRAACLLMLEALRNSHCQKVLNDNSNITQAKMRFTDWGVWWLEEMRTAGLLFLAWVLPQDLLARQAAETTVHSIERPRVGTFDDVASAYGWLQQQEMHLN